MNLTLSLVLALREGNGGDGISSSELKWGILKKSILVLALSCLALAGCAGAPAATPAVTQTVTEIATATATVTATSTPAPVVTPAAAIPTPAATTAVIPANVAGMNAEALDDELQALGFKKVVYNADTGKTVILLSNWTVTGIDNAGMEQATSKAVVVHVTK